MVKKKNSYFYDGKIIRVIDGDTFEIVFDLGFYVTVRTKCRLYGIDTPETRGKNKSKLGLEVKEYLEKLILDKTFEMDVLKTTGKYGRWLVDIYLDKRKNQTLTKLLLKKNMGKKINY